jgi:hypothetical protein
MCVKEIPVVGIDDERDAHEIEQYLRGSSEIDDVFVDELSETVTVEFDATETTLSSVLDQLEHSGCTPHSRVSGLVGRLATRLG